MPQNNNGALGQDHLLDTPYSRNKAVDKAFESGYAQLEDHEPTRGRKLIEFKRSFTKRKKAAR